MVTGLEWGILTGITLLTGLVSAYIVYRVIRKGLKATVNGYIPVIGKAVRSEMKTFASEALENVDIGAIAGQLGGGESDTGGLGALSGILGGGSGGLGDLLGLLTQFSSAKTKKGGHNPGR